MATFGTNIYDPLVARIAMLLPSHLRLPDAYNLEDNNHRYLKQGWALAIGAGSNPFRFVSCRRSLQIDMLLAISREWYALEHDPASKANAEKSLVSDLETIYDDICTNNLGLNDSVIQLLSFEGLTSIDDENAHFRILNATISVEYFRG